MRRSHVRQSMGFVARSPRSGERGYIDAHRGFVMMTRPWIWVMAMVLGITPSLCASDADAKKSHARTVRVANGEPLGPPPRAVFTFVRRRLHVRTIMRECPNSPDLVGPLRDGGGFSRLVPRQAVSSCVWETARHIFLSAARRTDGLTGSRKIQPMRQPEWTNRKSSVVSLH